MMNLLITAIMMFGSLRLPEKLYDFGEDVFIRTWDLLRACILHRSLWLINCTTVFSARTGILKPSLRTNQNPLRTSVRVQTYKH
jgi:hypothetical protein